MKKRLIAFLLISMMALSFAVPAMAAEAVVTDQISAEAEQEIAPRTEMTRIYFRNYNGRPQARVWSITNGRWITDWMYL